MSKPTITVPYPAFMKWVRTLDAWSALATQSTAKAATQAIWRGDREAVHEWIEHGHGLMTLAQWSPSTAQELMELVKKGCIDPGAVEQQLMAQNWDYQFYDDYGENREVEDFPLSESWGAAMGCAMVLTRSALPWCENSARWLEEGCGLFLMHTDTAQDTYTSLVDKSHEDWLLHLCCTQPGAREAVAKRFLDEETMPAWPWVFHEDLGQAPSAKFIEAVMQLLDEQLPDAGPSEKLNLLQMHAPALHSSFVQAREVYLALYGPVPNDFSDSLRYLENRAETVRSMFAQGPGSYPGKEELLELSSTSPSMEKLFCTDGPCSAV